MRDRGVRIVVPQLPEHRAGTETRGRQHRDGDGGVKVHETAPSAPPLLTGCPGKYAEVLIKAKGPAPASCIAAVRPDPFVHIIGEQCLPCNDVAVTSRVSRLRKRPIFRQTTIEFCGKNLWYGHCSEMQE